MHTLSIIIPVYKDWERLQRCLEALLVSPVQKEILIVNNDPVHEVPDWFRKQEGVTILHEPKPGSYAARNCGAANANGSIFAFTDSDCIPDSEWCSNILTHFNTTNADLLGGKVDLFRPGDGGYWAYLYEKNLAFRQDLQVPKGRSVTANLAVKKTVFDNLNGFNAGMMSGGDWEFTERAVASGYLIVYCADVVVKHPTRRLIRDIRMKHRRLTAGGYCRVQKEHGHSGIRIVMSHLLNGMKGLLKWRRNLSFKESIVLAVVSWHLFFYRTWLYLLFITGLADPEKVRK